MTNEQLVNKIGLALIAAGHALVGTAKFEGKTEAKAATTAEPQTEAAPKEEKPKRKRRTKAEIAAEKAAKEAETQEASEEVTEDDFGGEEEVPMVETTVDEDTLKKALVTYAKKEGKEKAFGILGKYGAKKVADLDPSKYVEVYEEVAINA